MRCVCRNLGYRLPRSILRCDLCSGEPVNVSLQCASQRLVPCRVSLRYACCASQRFKYPVRRLPLCVVVASFRHLRLRVEHSHTATLTPSNQTSISGSRSWLGSGKFSNHRAYSEVMDITAAGGHPALTQPAVAHSHALFPVSYAANFVTTSYTVLFCRPILPALTHCCPSQSQLSRNCVPRLVIWSITSH